MTNGLKMLIVADGLEAAAQIIKEYIDNQTVTVEDFTGATTLAGGASGLVPAPSAGDGARYLSAGGDWQPLILGTTPSTVEGAMWLGVSS